MEQRIVVAVLEWRIVAERPDAAIVKRRLAVQQTSEPEMVHGLGTVHGVQQAQSDKTRVADGEPVVLIHPKSFLAPRSVS